MSEDKTGVAAEIKGPVRLRHDQLAAEQEKRLETLAAGRGQMSLLPMIADEADPAAEGLQLLDQPEDDTPGQRGPGRPKGARNKRTQHTLEYLQSLGYDDPLRGLAEVFTRSPVLLAAELGCTVLEAFDRQQEARKIALPFWHQKLPQAIVIDPTAAMTMVMIGATEMHALLSQKNDAASQKGLELLGPLLEHAANEAATEEEGEGDDG